MPEILNFSIARLLSHHFRVNRDLSEVLLESILQKTCTVNKCDDSDLMLLFNYLVKHSIALEYEQFA